MFHKILNKSREQYQIAHKYLARASQSEVAKIGCALLYSGFLKHGAGAYAGVESHGKAHISVPGQVAKGTLLGHYPSFCSLRVQQILGQRDRYIFQAKAGAYPPGINVLEHVEYHRGA